MTRGAFLFQIHGQSLLTGNGLGDAFFGDNHSFNETQFDEVILNCLYHSE